jgi:hypothetical protein
MNRALFLSARIAALGATVSLLACSSAVTPTARTESTYIPGAGVMSVTGENGTISVNIGAELQTVWRVLPTAFDSAGIQLTLIEPKQHLMANEGFKVRGKLRNERLSTYFECGTTQVGPNADSYELFVTVRAFLEPVKNAPQWTKMTVAVTAAAKPLQFAQDYSRCTSKTILERRMIDIIANAVKK